MPPPLPVLGRKYGLDYSSSVVVVVVVVPARRTMDHYYYYYSMMMMIMPFLETKLPLLGHGTLDPADEPESSVSMPLFFAVVDSSSSRRPHYY